MTSASPEERHRRRLRQRFILVAAVVTVGVAAVAFTAGLLGSPAAPGAAPQASPAATSAVRELTIAQLDAGTCLAGFTSAWQAGFEAADCAQPHAAELYAVVAAADDGAPYPGEPALRANAARSCQSPEALATAAAAAIGDLRIQAAYALDETEWQAGVRHYWCFASRDSGETLLGSLRAG